MGVVLLCPGQGAIPRDLGNLIQASGDDLAEAYAGRLGADAWDDPLADFARQQAALVTIGIGRGRRALALLAQDDLAEQFGPVVGTAGHSLGELVALCLAGVLEPGDAVRLAADRGAAFQQHRLPVWDEAGMLALRGAAVHELIDGGLLERHGAEYGNDNAPDQVVATGLTSALDAVAVEARELGLRAVSLETTGPTHSSFMRPVADTFRSDLQRASFADPAVPVFSGHTAAPFQDYVDELATIVAGPVRWRETLVALATDLQPTHFLDIGPGKVLANLARKTVPEIPAHTLDELESAR